MLDFNSSNSNEMHYKELADSVHHFKETLDNMGVSDKKERDVIAKLLQE